MPIIKSLLVHIVPFNKTWSFPSSCSERTKILLHFMIPSKCFLKPLTLINSSYILSMSLIRIHKSFTRFMWASWDKDGHLILNRCVDAIKNSQYADLANDLEINKAVMYLRQKNFKDAVETLKMFEKKETKVASTAATNLSFLYFLVSFAPSVYLPIFSFFYLLLTKSSFI